MIALSDGSCAKFYCKKCGREVSAPSVYFSLSMPLHYVRCNECKNCTPMFRHQIDALKDYKDKWGLTYEIIKEDDNV